MTQENGYQKVGKNSLIAPRRLVELSIVLKPVYTFVISVSQPFNRLYTMWKPSHFYTGLEIHSADCSWRTFRVDSETFAATKMYLQRDDLVIEVFANTELSECQISNLREHVIRSYGLTDAYHIPTHIFEANPHVKAFSQNCWEQESAALKVSLRYLS